MLTLAAIVPCHNYAQYLPACLRSILGQTQPPAEIVVVDDSSTDNTRQVAEAFATTGVCYLRIDARNPFEARKAGIRATTSPLVCCIDADDQISSRYFERGEPLFTNPEVGIVWPDFQEFGDRCWTCEPIPCDIQERNYIHSGSIVRRAALERSRAYETPCTAHWEDWETWKRVMADGWQTTKNPALYLYRKHANTRSSSLHSFFKTYAANAPVAFVHK